MKRQRGRGRRSGGGNSNNPNRHFESNGPDVKIRGSAQQILDKYQQYARDAQSSGDRVSAENYLQHAEHYSRILAAMQPKEKPRDEQRANPSEGETAEAGGTLAAGDGSAPATEGEDGDNSRRRNNRRRKRSDQESAAPDEAVAESAADTEPKPAETSDPAAASSETSEEAEKPPRPRRSRKKPAAAAEASEQEDGVLKTISRGRETAPESLEAAITETGDVSETAAE